MTTDRAHELSTGAVFLELPGLVANVSTSVKLEGLNPAGSIKAKAARQMVEEAEDCGRLSPGSRIIESTSGNLGVALASICAAKDYRITLVTDPNTSTRAVRSMTALGAEVVMVTERDHNGGFLQSRIDQVHRRLAGDPDLVWLNQYANPGNVAAHRRHTGPEILSGFGVPDWLFIGTGTGGTLMGCLEFLRGRQLDTVVVAVDAAGSVTFGGTPGRRWIPGIGTSRRPEIVVDDGTFRKVQVSEVDAVRMCRLVARRHGLLLGGSSGSTLAAVAQMRQEIPDGSRVLAISADMGDGYLDTVYDDDWVRQRYGAEALTGTTLLHSRALTHQ